VYVCINNKVEKIIEVRLYINHNKKKKPKHTHTHKQKHTSATSTTNPAFSAKACNCGTEKV
jgi:hypothetical protein